MNNTKNTLAFCSENELLEALLLWEGNRKMDAARHLRNSIGHITTLDAIKLLTEIAKEWKM